MKINICTVRNIILSICFYAVLISCHQNNKSRLEQKDTADSKMSSRSKYNLSDSVSITPLPFGPELLVTYKFPNGGWSSGEIEGIHGDKNLDSICQKKFNQAGKEFAKINFAKSIKTPLIKKVEYINIEDDSLIVKHYRNFQSDFKFRLPNIGPYECFYQFHQSIEPHSIVTKDDKTFSDYGNIVLYDKKTLSAKFLNVYNSFNFREEDFGGSERFFFIEKNGVIYIFKNPITEDINSVIRLQKITVLKDSQIQIEKLK